MTKKRKIKNPVKKHEGMYIHISKKWLRIFYPICVVVPLIYMVWMVLCLIANLTGFMIASVFVPLVSIKNIKYFWTLNKYSFKEITPKWLFELE